MVSRGELYNSFCEEVPGAENVTVEQIRKLLMKTGGKFIESDLFYEAMARGDKVNMIKLKEPVLEMLKQRAEREKNPQIRRVLELEGGAIEELAKELLKGLQ